MHRERRSYWIAGGLSLCLAIAAWLQLDRLAHSRYSLHGGTWYDVGFYAFLLVAILASSLTLIIIDDLLLLDRQED